MINLIFDNDAASDDAMALVYLATNSRVSIRGISIAGTGLADGKIGADNFANLCHALKLSDVPIAYGRKDSLDGFGKPFPRFLLEKTKNMLKNKNLLAHPNPKITDNAVELIKNIIESSEENVTILATGPLTNVAEFLKQYPQSKNKIDKIVIMGGAIAVRGNIKDVEPKSNNQVAEWNIYADPKAAQFVFSSGVKVILVPLDATNQALVTKEFYETLAEQSSLALNLVYRFLKDVVDNPRCGMEFLVTKYYLWDPLAAMICVDPKIASLKSLPISIDLDTAQTKLETDSKNGTMIDVAVRVASPSSILSRFIQDIQANLIATTLDPAPEIHRQMHQSENIVPPVLIAQIRKRRRNEVDNLDFQDNRAGIYEVGVDKKYELRKRKKLLL